MDAAAGPLPEGGESRVAAGAVLAFDYGDKRIGVAVGDTAIGIAHPLEQIAFEDNRRRLQAVERLLQQWRPARLVVGVRVAGDGGDHPVGVRARRFAQRLGARFRLPVDLVDEHLSSWEASRKLTAAGVRARGQRAHIDALAACGILERWFESRRQRATLAEKGWSPSRPG